MSGPPPATTTEAFLLAKLANMKSILRNVHGARAARLDQVEARIRRESSVTAYACQLNDGRRDAAAVADQVVAYCEVDDQSRPAARACVLSYLECFAEVARHRGQM